MAKEPDRREPDTDEQPRLVVLVATLGEAIQVQQFDPDAWYALAEGARARWEAAQDEHGDHPNNLVVVYFSDDIIDSKRLPYSPRWSAAPEPQRLGRSHGGGSGREAAAAAELLRVNDALSMRASDEIVPTPVIVYVENSEDYTKVRGALEGVLEAFDQEVILESRQVRGSVWQSFVTIFKKRTTPDQLESATDIFAAAVKARLYSEPQAQVTKAQGEAISNLIKSLESTPNALIQFSNLLIIKADSVPYVRELTPEQAEFIKRNPHLQFNPKEALAVLDHAFVTVENGDHGEGQQAITP
ncbi:hypothetical protein AB0C10_20815 [Microbispora amethystogenes]|uniref:hypothetical protein n=1 Tax=Microbispora amethystogenes TaxID=1427754 RepID=UPI0033D975C1